MDDAEVSLNERRVRVRFSRKHSVSLADLRRVIREQGFSPREATLTLAGRVEGQPGALSLVIPGADIILEIVAERDIRQRLAGLIGKAVVVEAHVAADHGEVTPSQLQISSVRAVG